MHTQQQQRMRHRGDARSRGGGVVLVLLLGLIGRWQTGHAADFACRAGDVACLINAIHTANANGETNRLRLAAGTYTLTTVDNYSFGSTGLPSITSPLTITGAGANTTRIERQARAPYFRLLHVEATGRLTLERITLLRGKISGGGGGGGLYNNGGRVTLIDSTLRGNATDSASGGGLFNNGGTVRLINSTLRGNAVVSSANASGGGLFTRGGTVRLTNSTLRGNTVSHEGAGAGLYNAGSTVMIISSTISMNITEGTGGGISNWGPLTIIHSTLAANRADELGGGITNGGSLRIINSTLAHNVADTGLGGGHGGGIANWGPLTIINSTLAHNVAIGGMTGGTGGGITNSGPLTIINSTLAHNVAMGGVPGGTGGGLSNHGGTVTITNSTLAHNRSSAGEREGGGGGIWSRGSGSVELQNTILALNTTDGTDPGPDCLGPITSRGHNLIGDPTGCTITLHRRDLTGDPGLDAFTNTGTPGEGHFPLLATSRAIDAGRDAACPPTDQLGQPRVGPCDIGAIEFQPVVQSAEIAIKPGAALPRLNPRSHGKIAVAILTTDTVDATTVRVSTVRFGATGTEAAAVGSAVDDVNADGRSDLLLRFHTPETALQCGDTAAVLTGTLGDGQQIRGADTLHLVGCAALAVIEQ